MQNNIRYSNAMAELLHYLKGIKQSDVNKVPNKLIEFFKENASKDYNCDFDYTKPLKEIKLQEETKGLIAMLCLKYWCETEEQRQQFIAKLNENERKYQEELSEKYNPDNIFKKEEQATVGAISNCSKEADIIKFKESIFKRILNIIKKIFRK